MTMFAATCLAVSLGITLFVVRLSAEQRQLNRTALRDREREHGAL